MTLADYLDRNVEYLHRVRDDMAATKIRLGHRVTADYRAFCHRAGVDLVDGPSLPGRPWPFPIDKALTCTDCGESFSRPDYRLTLSGGYGPEREEDAYEALCPWCLHRDCIVEAITCPECADYPCTCEPN